MSTVEKCEAANQLVAAFIILVLQLSYSAITDSQTSLSMAKISMPLQFKGFPDAIAVEFPQTQDCGHSWQSGRILLNIIAHEPLKNALLMPLLQAFVEVQQKILLF